MRACAAWIAAIAAGCVRIAPEPAPPAPVSYPTLEPDAVFDPRPIGLANLKSIAGAASIALEVGPGPLLRTQSCGPGDEAGAAASAATSGSHASHCYRCTLAVAETRAGEPLHPLEVPLRTLADTLLAYPHSFLRAARVERIALCHQLVRIPDNEDERVAGLAEGYARRLMVSVGRTDAPRAEATLHHEIFHLFDYATAAGGDHRSDPAWERLNPRGFRYGDPSAALIEAGFVNDYAKTAAVEDKASVFEYLMSYPAELCGRAVDDPTLMAKARLLLARIDAAVPPGFGDFARRRASCLARP